MKKFITMIALVLSATAALRGSPTDGTWAFEKQGGDWATSGNWVNGILPTAGGTAAFVLNVTQSSEEIYVTGATATIGTLAVTNKIRYKDGSGTICTFKSGTLDFADPARIVSGGASTELGGRQNTAHRRYRHYWYTAPESHNGADL